MRVLASLVGAGLTDAQTGAHVPIVASIGLAGHPEEAEAVDDLIRLSDSAMYAANASGIVSPRAATTWRSAVAGRRPGGDDGGAPDVAGRRQLEVATGGAPALGRRRV